ncbi:MAG: ATP-binding protein [Nitrospinota bacterium]
MRIEGPSVGDGGEDRAQTEGEPGTRFSILSTLRARLLFLAALALCPVIALFLITAREQRLQAIADVESDALWVARLITSERARLIQEIWETRSFLAELASHSSVREGDFAKCRMAFSQRLKESSPYLNLGVIRPNGQIACSALPVDGPVNLADRAYFWRALKSRDFAVGEFEIDRLTTKASISFGFPILDDDGSVQGVVFASLALPQLSKFAGETPLPKQFIVTLMDQNGAILARSHDPKKWVGQHLSEDRLFRKILTQGQGVQEHWGEDGLPYLLAFTTLRFQPDAGGLYLTIAIPEKIAFGHAEQTLMRNIFTLFSVTIFALLAAWFAGKRILLQPINALVGATKRLASGDLGTRTGLPHGQGELGQLARSFDEMAENLERQKAEAERANKEIRETQAKLLQSEKLSSIGTLVAGVAHEILNPMNNLYIKVQLMQEGIGTENPEELKESFGSMRMEIERASRITKNLVDFARKREPQLKRVDIRGVLDRVVGLVEYQYRVTNVQFVKDYSKDLPQLEADEGQLSQVFLNLMGNAKDAMPEGGQVTLRARSFFRNEDPWVRVGVEDTGKGIPRDIVKRIFDPFFTTKPEGKGTGLGLSVTYGIVENHGGKLEVESEEGKGTTFMVELPATMEVGNGDGKNPHS